MNRLYKYLKQLEISDKKLEKLNIKNENVYNADLRQKVITENLANTNISGEFTFLDINAMPIGYVYEVNEGITYGKVLYTDCKLDKKFAADQDGIIFEEKINIDNNREDLYKM
ncbi:MAG: hypothetical protein N4A47_03310 [Clostridia bacterium]|jgi:hypothetical protein|nr:hypothetical protein [Clostridia bacterium]